MSDGKWYHISFASEIFIYCKKRVKVFYFYIMLFSFVENFTLIAGMANISVLFIHCMEECSTFFNFINAFAFLFPGMKIQLVMLIKLFFFIYL